MIKKTIIFGIIIALLISNIPYTIINLETAANNPKDYDMECTGFDDSTKFAETDIFPADSASSKTDGTNGPLGEWPDFTPIGFITAPHPDNPEYQTHLYGDWGGIVGEEFIFLQDSVIKLLYHSYHETYMTQRERDYIVLDNWSLGYDPVRMILHHQLPILLFDLFIGITLTATQRASRSS